MLFRPFARESRVVAITCNSKFSILIPPPLRSIMETGLAVIGGFRNSGRADTEVLALKHESRILG